MGQTARQMRKLQDENRQLKELVKTRMEDLCDSCGASSMMPMPCNLYKQALLDIKEIIIKQGFISKNTEIVKGSVLYHCLKGLKIPDGMSKKILKKCEEVGVV